ncbi:hypothetical protein CAPTEDRAFT_228129 [Capitella teleta]|uniref:Fork-head domain-containing protein n=1 Tax=Capitella teleta TaxID=283909 RepID=R7UP22_CAPTE|nr:hypothetical protein CAPTEDRAFT_228129 [Capitella teleta]|eukprot:ELU05126.1 hypothetical protein CAPTEDRAFT_228129 [Capitella teleta]
MDSPRKLDSTSPEVAVAAKISTPTNNNGTLRAIRKSKIGFSERLKSFLSSPNYGDGLGSKLRPISRPRKRRGTTLRSMNCIVPSMDFDCPLENISLKRRKSSWVKSDLKDLACIIGISSSDLSPKQIQIRKGTIQLKTQISRFPDFTLEEEYDIHSRAECYVDQIKADPQHYISADDFMENMGHDVESVCLPNGVQLIKPTEKLVELVAHAIHCSPDQMLQVQQVYTALQKRFPFFQCLDKSCLTSWRSSIRHALFQKWFHKLIFQCAEISSRGCYWTINRDHRPKEWNLPPPITDENREEEPFDVETWTIQCSSQTEHVPETDDIIFLPSSSEEAVELRVISRNPNPMLYTPPLSQQDNSDLLEQVMPHTPSQLDPSSPTLFPDWLSSPQDLMLDKSGLLAETDALFQW